LTDAGEKLLVRIRPAVMELDAAVEELAEFRNTPTGTLRLNVSGVAAQIVLAPVVKAFLAAYPAISLDITVDDGQGDIARGRYDAGIRVGRVVAKDMQIVRVSAPSRLIAIAAPEYLQHCPPLKVPQDLQQHNCIRLRSNRQILPWDFAKGKSRVEISVNGSLVVNNVNFMVQAALDGIGIGYAIESYVARYIAQRRLVALLRDWSPEHHSYYLYYSGRRHLPVALKTFIAFLRRRQREAEN
jgi:DNA-binding transcriptional LysR family regulator